MIEIIPGICQLKIPIPDNPLGCTNIYLLRGTDGWLMIDTGWDSDQALKSMKKQLAEIGIGFKDISRILITHTHADHYGLVTRMKKYTSAPISVHKLEKEMLSLRSADMSKMMGQHAEWFTRHGVPSETFPINRITPADRRRFRNPTDPDDILEGNETISTGVFNLELFWTPGHSPGHLCFYEREKKILFTGDHVLPGITPNISLQPHIGGNPLGDFLHAMTTLRELDVDIALPAHENIFNDLKGRIDGIFGHHQHRYSEIIEAIKSGARTAYDISHGITWLPDYGGVSFMELTPWTRRMAVSETLAHLKAMEVEGIVESYANNGFIHYRYML